MVRPLIGITMDSGDKPGKCALNSDYTTSIEKAGGIPFPIPFTTGDELIREIVDRVQGVLFSGGDDLDPALYGEAWHPKAIPIDPRRQAFELKLIAEVERRRMPALGICLGSQLMNVHRGGALHQFLPDLSGKLEHRKVGEEIKRHPVTVNIDSQLGRALGKGEVSVNTYHKQAMKTMGRGLRVVATAPDGVIEGFEDPAFPLFAAVQWHPERLINEREHLALFELLVQKSK